MRNYGVINLTVDAEPYLTFDSIRKAYFEKRGLLFRNVLNAKAARPLGPHELLFVSSCEHPSGIPVMLEKFLWALRVLLADPVWRACDYFVRVNSSTFLNVELFDSFIRSLPARRCYAGPVMFKRFVSGTCIVLSRDVAEFLATRKIGKEADNYDDLAISHFLKRRLLRMIDMPMRFFDDNKTHALEEVVEALDSFSLIRVKNNADRMLYDVDIWRKIAIAKGIQ
jgi:hypothetical protein